MTNILIFWSPLIIITEKLGVTNFPRGLPEYHVNWSPGVTNILVILSPGDQNFKIQVTRGDQIVACRAWQRALHTKSTPLSDFFETWYIDYIVWVEYLSLLIYILGKIYFYANHTIHILNALLHDNYVGRGYLIMLGSKVTEN